MVNWRKRMYKIDRLIRKGMDSEVAMKCFGVVIVIKHPSHPDIQLTLHDLETVQDVILNEVTQSVSTKPKFIDIKHGEGFLELICYDRETAQWLKGLEHQLQSENVPILVEEDKEQLPRETLVGYFPYSKACPEERILELIDAHNRGICTSSWTILSQEPLDNLVKLVISVDYECFERLGQRYFKLNYGLKKVVLKKYVDKFEDSFQVVDEVGSDDEILDENSSCKAVSECSENLRTLSEDSGSFRTLSECSASSAEETAVQKQDPEIYLSSVEVPGTSGGFSSKPVYSTEPGSSMSASFKKFLRHAVESTTHALKGTPVDLVHGRMSQQASQIPGKMFQPNAPHGERFSGQLSGQMPSVPGRLFEMAGYTLNACGDSARPGIGNVPMSFPLVKNKRLSKNARQKIRKKFRNQMLELQSLRNTAISGSVEEGVETNTNETSDQYNPIHNSCMPRSSFDMSARYSQGERCSPMADRERSGDCFASNSCDRNARSEIDNVPKGLPGDQKLSKSARQRRKRKLKKQQQSLVSSSKLGFVEKRMGTSSMYDDTNEASDRYNPIYGSDMPRSSFEMSARYSRSERSRSPMSDRVRSGERWDGHSCDSNECGSGGSARSGIGNFPKSLPGDQNLSKSARQRRKRKLKNQQQSLDSSSKLGFVEERMGTSSMYDDTNEASNRYSPMYSSCMPRSSFEISARYSRGERSRSPMSVREKSGERSHGHSCDSNEYGSDTSQQYPIFHSGGSARSGIGSFPKSLPGDQKLSKSARQRRKKKLRKQQQEQQSLLNNPNSASVKEGMADRYPDRWA